MKRMEKEINALARKMSDLSRRLDRIAKEISKEKIRPEKVKKIGKGLKVRKRARKKSSLVDKVIHVIDKAKKGMSIPALKQKTGLGDRQLSNVLYKLTKKGIVRTEARGIYTKG